MLSILTNKLKLWILFGAGLTLMITTIVFSPQVNERFSQLLIIKNGNFNGDSGTIRSNLNECTIELLPDAGFLGYGIGDGKTQLQDCFNSVNSDLAYMSYNTHNQYLSIVMNVGFIGLVIFLGSLFILSIISLNKKNYLAITMLILLAVWMLAENILERQGGVMFFSLFTGFLFVLNFKSIGAGSFVLSHERVMGMIKK
jgi:O-antigen ligase